MKHYAFCPVCGACLPRPVEPREQMDVYRCARCGFEFWQNSKPTAAALVEREKDGRRQVLLALRAIEPHKGMWGIPGGYLHNGEEPKEGLRREMREELGVEIENLRLFGVQINEYPREDIAEEARFLLALYYRCSLAPDAAPAAADDVAAFGWFDLESLPSDIAFAANRRTLEALREAEGPW